jgi:outer membrane protein assembly factor BamB
VLGIDWKAERVAWEFGGADEDTPFLSSVAVTDRLVILGGRDKRLHALDRSTGQEKWRFSAKGRIDSSPVIAGDRVFVGSADGNVYGIDRDRGVETWRFETGSAISASPSIGYGRLVIGTEDGVLYCFGSG